MQLKEITVQDLDKNVQQHKNYQASASISSLLDGKPF